MQILSNLKRGIWLITLHGQLSPVSVPLVRLNARAEGATHQSCSSHDVQKAAKMEGIRDKLTL